MKGFWFGVRKKTNNDSKNYRCKSRKISGTGTDKEFERI